MKNLKQKNTFKFILAVFSLMLMVLPFMVLFNDVLTKWFEKAVLYRTLQEHVAPLEAKIVGAALIPLGFDYVVYSDGMKVNGVSIGLSWNCLGWQSLILFLITMVLGLKGNYTWLSKIEAFLIGLLSLFLVNVFRLTFTTILAVSYRQLFVIVFHDYLAAIVTVLWLILFWYFTYAFVLEEEQRQRQRQR